MYTTRKNQSLGTQHFVDYLIDSPNPVCMQFFILQLQKLFCLFFPKMPELIYRPLHNELDFW